MATILKNVLRFTGLVIGVPTLQPHLLNVDTLGAVTPNLTFPDRGPFIVAVDATNVTVTRVATSPGDTVDVYVEFVYSPSRVFNPAEDPPTEFPFVLQPGGGGGGSAGSSNSLIFRPGSAFVGPTIFGLWADLITRLTALRAASNGGGTYEIGIDDSTISPAVIPAGAYDMAGVTIVGAAPENALAVAEIPEGTTFTNLRKLDGFLEFSVTAGVTNPIADIGAGETFEIGVRTGGTAMRSVAGAVAAINNAAGGSGRTIALGKNSAIGLVGGGSGPTIRHVGLSSLLITADSSSVIEEDALENNVNAFLSYIAIAASAQINQPQGNVNVTSFFIFNSLFPRFTVLARTSAVPNLTENTLGLIDVSGGAVAQSLPEIALAGEHVNEGMSIIMAESSGTAGLTVAPSGADTIDGSALAVSVPAGGALVLVSDGVSNWKTVSIFGGGPIWNVRSGIVADPAPVAVGDLIEADPTGGAFAVTIPAINAANKGRAIIVKNVTASATAITVTATGADTIDTLATFPITAGFVSITLVSDGTSNWNIV